MKTKVKFNEAVAGDTFGYRPGEVAYLDATLADAWIASGRVKLADEDPSDLKKQIAELQERLRASEKK